MPDYLLVNRPFRGSLPHFKITKVFDDPDEAYWVAAQWCEDYCAKDPRARAAWALGANETGKDRFVGVMNYSSRTSSMH